MVKFHLSHSQLNKVKAGKPVLISHEAVGHGIEFKNLHPLNHMKLAKRKHGKGVRLHLTPPEFEDCSAEGLWSWLKGAAKKTYGFVKDNWKDIKPIVSTALDAASQAYPQYSTQRQQFKQLTGVGMNQGPTHFPGQPIEEKDGSGFHMRKTKKKAPVKKKRVVRGNGIIPAGFSTF